MHKSAPVTTRTRGHSSTESPTGQIDKSQGRAADRPLVRVLGGHRDVGAPDGDRSRPGAADAVRHAGRPGSQHEAYGVLSGAPEISLPQCRLSFQ